MTTETLTLTPSSTGGGIGVENTEKVREHVRRVFEGELELTLTEAFNRVLNDYVARPYQ